MAEEVFQVLTWRFRCREEHEARSAGTHPDPGGRRLTRADVEWADVVCVMEETHQVFIRSRWRRAGRKIRVLGIPDVYMPGDPILKDLLATHILTLLAEAAAPETPSNRRG